MALIAAREAMNNAAIGAEGRRIGLVVGGTTAGMFENEELLSRLHDGPRPREIPRSLLSHPLTSTGDLLSEALGPFARVRTLSSACSSGANALIVAALWLEGAFGEGGVELDAVVAGGCDGLCRLTFSGFNALGAMDPEPCRPFDRRRRGLSLGEGAGFVVLERAEVARARGAEPLAELAGWALGSEAHHITNPAPDGATISALVSSALRRAAMMPSDVDYVSAHGTATVLSDPIEAAALTRSLGSEIERIPVSSSKGQLGHTLGAAGAIEAAICALVVSRRTLVPTVGLDEPDPAIHLVHVSRVGQVVSRVRAAISNSFGFGGMDSVLVLADPHNGAVGRSSRPSASRHSSPVETESSPCVVTGAAVFGPPGILGARECASLLERAFDSQTAVVPEHDLDLARARRLDRASRLAVVAAERALRDSGARPNRTGVVFGRAFGQVAGSSAYMRCLLGRGPRAASPAEFPNLAPSALVGHLSIYLGLEGPSFMTADPSTCGEAAFIQALELVRCGEVSSVVAGAVDAKGSLAEDLLTALFVDHSDPDGGPASSLASAVVVERRRDVEQRGGSALAMVSDWVEWRQDGGKWLAALGTPRGPRTEVLLPRANESSARLLGDSMWGSCPRMAVAPILGGGDAVGAATLAIAVGRLATGIVDEALVIGSARSRGSAIVLRRAQSRDEENLASSRNSIDLRMGHRADRNGP